jgi:hypothetical protein
VADLVRINNGDIMKIMQVISKHIGLTLYEVCHKGMTAIWNKILNDSISRRISLIGYDNIPPVLRKLYSNNQSYLYYSVGQVFLYSDQLVLRLKLSIII